MEVQEKSIRFPASVHAKLQKLALKFGRTQVQFFIQMVDYFYSTKKDPKDINDEVLKNTLAENHKTYIKFIRAQEQNLLIPVKTDMDRMIQSQNEIIRCFNEHVLKANEQIESRQESMATICSRVERGLSGISARMEEKERLKRNFLHILNSYIKARDQLKIMSSSSEKEELAFQTRDQISNL